MADPCELPILKHRRLIIHAGTHKTGSTTLQNYLFAQTEHPHFDYICDRDANSSLLMIQAFHHNLAQLPHFQHAKFSDRDIEFMKCAARERFYEMVAATSKPNSVLSAEDISIFTIPELEDLYQFLAPLFQELEVIIYVRPVKARMESAFQEVLKTRYRSLEQQFHLNYIGMARNFDSVFGRDKVHFYLFSRKSLPKGDIVTHFLNAAGLTGASVENTVDNIRLSKESVQLLYIYRLHFPEVLPGDDQRVRALSALEGDPFHFHSNLFQKLLRTGKNASEKFAQRAGFSIDEDIYANDDIGIRTEDDLMKPSSQSISWLHEQLSCTDTLSLPRSSDPETIARAVHALA